MRDTSEPSGNNDFESLEQTLRDERPRPTGQELERARHIALSSSRGRRQRGTRLGFRPGLARVAMVSLISGAFMVAGSTATLAVSGISGDGSAGTAQYSAPPGNTSAPGGSEEVLGDLEPGGSGDVEPSNETGTSPADAERQVASAGDDSLPFTGLVMVPLLVLGSVLLVSGFVLRRRAQDGAHIA